MIDKLLKEIEEEYINSTTLQDIDHFNTKWVPRLVKALRVCLDGLANIRKYSLGSKADTCDECKEQVEIILNGDE